MARKTASVLTALYAALRATETSGADGAAVALAKQYAAEIDDGGCGECGSRFERMEKLGPKLLAALEALSMTPRSRAALVKGGPDVGASPLDELRQRRAARLDGAAAVDATAT